MITVKGKYNEAKIFTSNIDERTKEEIKLLCDQEAYLNSVIRIMPDCHSGMGCTIGTTMTIKDKITPNLVGVDIGCGVLCVQLGDIDINLEELDKYIRNNIPHGFSINGKAQYDYTCEIEKLLCYKKLGKSSEEFNRAIGSLGGGNHFIEIDKDKNGNKYLMIHTGSRNLGNRVAKYYQDMAYENCNGHANNEAKAMLINKMIDEGKEHQIQTALKTLKPNKIPKDLCYLEGNYKGCYLFDMDIVQNYASLNRQIIADRLVNQLGLHSCNLTSFETVHNYIDLDSMILRKGAVSAKEGELLVIPINMRDGVLLARGKGNEDWNYSAPHGAGRILSRKQAKDKIDIEAFRESMKDIYTTSVGKGTLDEAPQAYKNITDITDNIGETVEILELLNPIYNFKSSN